MKLLPPKYEKSKEIHSVLLFLVFFLFHFPSLSFLELVGCSIGLFLFLGLYYFAHWQTGFTAVLSLSAILALGILLVPVNTGGSVFFTYSAALAGLFFTFKRASIFVSVVLLIYLSESYYLGASTFAMLGYGALIVVITAIYMQVRSSEFIHERLHRREEEIQFLSTFNERQRISSDLHDILGQSFSVISVKAELCQKLLLLDLEKATSELVDIAETARSSLGKVRAIIDGYHETALDAELATAAQLLKASNIQLNVNRSVFDLSPAISSFLALILRESITNIAQHSRSQNCHVSFEQVGDMISMAVMDDGIGYNNGEGRGLRGMRERASRMNAEFQISGTNGTTIRILISDKHSITNDVAQTEAI